MSRIYKATIYCADVNDEFNGVEQFLSEIERKMDISMQSYDVKQSEDFEWEDDLDINQRDCTREDYDVYLK